MILNLIATAIFALSLYLRMGGIAGAPLPVLLSIVGILLVALSGWLGGEMVYVHGMGVQQPETHAKAKPSPRSESYGGVGNRSR